MSGEAEANGTGGFLGVISDTHGLVRPEAREALDGAEVLLHAGDIGSPDVIAELEELAPVVCVRGNVDVGTWARSLQERQRFEWNGVRFLVLHNVADLDARPPEEDVDVVVFGHSHRHANERRDGRLFLNPGSAGPRRFTLPVSVARVDLVGGAPQARIVELDV